MDGHHWPSFATLWVSRETLRLAVFFGNTPFWTARMISGSATFMAASAVVLSQDTIAYSTLRTNPRTRERLLLLMAVRRAILRAAFLAEVVLAMSVPLRRLMPYGPSVSPLISRKIATRGAL